MPDFDLAEMLRRETTFYAGFTHKAERPYGLLYFNERNPLSHDSNHAHITDLAYPLDAALDDIIAFYRQRGLTPRLYASWLDGELEGLRPYFDARGFQVESRANHFMRFIAPRLPEETAATVQRINHLSRDIVELIHTHDEGDWGVIVLRHHIHDPSFHLLGLYDHGRCLALASLKIMDGYSRVDDVQTHAAFQRQGFATRLINHLVHYHGRRSNNHLCLWADNPAAIRMYHNVGFQDVPVDKPAWSAHLPA